MNQSALEVLIVPLSVALVELAKRMCWVSSVRGVLILNLILMAVLYASVQLISFHPELGLYVQSVFNVLVYALAASGLYSSNKALKGTPTHDISSDSPSGDGSGS